MSDNNMLTQAEKDKKYNNWARRQPAIISLVFPLICMVVFFFDYVKSDNTLSSYFEWFLKVLLVFTSITPALFFFFKFVVREVGTFIELLFELVFLRGTVKYLCMDSSTISTDEKNMIYEWAKQKYTIEIKDPKPTYKDRKSNEDKYKQISEIVHLAKEDSRDNSIMFENTCIYGFFRNLSGGILLNLIFCGCLMFAVKNNASYYEGSIYSICVLLFVFVVCLVCLFSSERRRAKKEIVILLGVINKERTT